MTESRESVCFLKQSACIFVCLSVLLELLIFYRTSKTPSNDVHTAWIVLTLVLHCVLNRFLSIWQFSTLSTSSFSGWNYFVKEVKNTKSPRSISNISRTITLASKQCFMTVLQKWAWHDKYGTSQPRISDSFCWVIIKLTIHSCCKSYDWNIIHQYLVHVALLQIKYLALAQNQSYHQSL